jgi:uncharacterized membrane protein
MFSLAYSFLDPAKGRGRLAVYIIGIAVVECVLFVIVRIICTVRERLVARRARSRLDTLTSMEQFNIS